MFASFEFEKMQIHEGVAPLRRTLDCSIPFESERLCESKTISQAHYTIDYSELFEHE